MAATVRLTGLSPIGVRVDAEPGQDVRALPVDELRELARTRLVVLLRGFTGPADPEELARWADGWGSPGPVLDSDEEPDGGRVPIHWDGLGHPEIPEFQIFACVRSGSGGHTTFTDTARLAADADPGTLRRWRSVSVTYRVRGTGARTPVVAAHPVHGTPVLRFHEPADEDSPLAGWPDHQFDGLPAEAVPGFLGELRAALRDPKYQYVHAWQEGDFLIADNHTLLHGRESGAAGRHLRRVHILTPH
ncbi:TauD/TfdA family dioxygenase [Amycolatopsis sp. NPDC059657]|uniref:TauD/TfdA family dioxygenase n=1 Tax=Amycolatopsis sp. NPDC059657 TaxID=3346899 RepID=UPI0036717DC9